MTLKQDELFDAIVPSLDPKRNYKLAGLVADTPITWFDKKEDAIRVGYINYKDLYKVSVETPYVPVFTANPRFTLNAVQIKVHVNDIMILPDIEKEVKPKAIVCDIDGVLNSYVKDRGVILKDGSCQDDWTKFSVMNHAKPNKTIFDMLKNFLRTNGEDARIIFLTARGETQRYMTHQFLEEGMEEWMCRTLTFMRGQGDNFKQAHDIKVEKMAGCVLPYFDVQFFIDDTPSNVEAIQKYFPDVPTMLIKP